MKDILMLGFFTGVWTTSSRTVAKDNKTVLAKMKRRSIGLYIVLKILIYSPFSFIIMVIQTVTDILSILAEIFSNILEGVKCSKF